MNWIKIVLATSLGSLLYLVAGLVFVSLFPDSYQHVPQFLSKLGTVSFIAAGQLQSFSGLAAFILLFTKQGRAATVQTKLFLVLAALIPVLMMALAVGAVFWEYSHGSQGH